MLSRIAGALKHIPERQFVLGRWFALLGWLSLIALLLHDPISPRLSAHFPNYASLHGEHVLSACVPFQANCLARPDVYFLGPPIFWGLVVPLSVFILLVFGHEVWRRICPLALVSQIPGLLGLQRRRSSPKVSSNGTQRPGRVVLIEPNSWLGRNHLWLQLGLLFLGLCARLWLIDSNRLGLATWLLLTLASALVVGALFGGKSWCNFFCPMAPVQRIYSAPGGILSTPAAWGHLPQSMCRTSAPTLTQEKPACVGCQKHCIDLDSERSYWETVTRHREKVLRYGYLGLVIGFFGYYYLQAGSWDYFFSGIWIQQETRMASLAEPGFYLFGQAIPIPKLFAVPLTLGSSMVVTWWLGLWSEKRYRRWKQQQGDRFSHKALQHRFFALVTFLAFNLFFVFAGRSWVLLLPPIFQYFYHTLIVLASGIWFYRNWLRTPERYLRESVASRLGKALLKEVPDLLTAAEVESLEDLNADELHVLHKVLPVLSQNRRQQLYQQVLQQLQQHQGIDGAMAQVFLADLQAQLGISPELHRELLANDELEPPSLVHRRAVLMQELAALSSPTRPRAFPPEEA